MVASRACAKKGSSEAMDLGLNGQVIIVSGGASGIGAAITRLCLEEGARVVVLSRISPGVAEFVDEQQEAGRPCELHEIELADADACRTAIDAIRSRHGRIDALVNNAGFNDGVSLSQGDYEAFLRSLQNNLLPAFVLTHAALPALKAARGCVINIGSKVALTGQGGTSGYAASKGGLLALTREWAAELLPARVRVNAVIPAEVMTPQYQTWLEVLGTESSERTKARITSQIPLERRMTTPDEIASAVVFLLSPVRSGHTTAQMLHVDGGYVHLDRLLTAPLGSAQLLTEPTGD
jgi:L-fucose dehydrogenase